MAHIEARLQKLGLTLPPPLRPPPGLVLPFRFVRVRGARAWIAGHGPQHADGGGQREEDVAEHHWIRMAGSPKRW